MSPVELIPPRLIAIASALSATAGIALMAVLGVFAIVAAYLVAKAHREGYARLSLPAAVTWYARLVLLGSIMLVAGGLASFLNLGLGAAFGPQYSYKAGVTTADYDLVAFQSLVLTGAGALAYLAHQALRRMVEPNAAAQPGKRFFLFANVAAFGLASVALLVGTGASLVHYHFGQVGEEAAAAAPGRAIAGLIVAVAFWVGSILAARRHLGPTGSGV